MNEFIPDGDLVCGPCYGAVERIIRDNIDPSRIKVMYTAVSWRNHDEMVALIKQVTRFKGKDEMAKAIAICDYLLKEGRLRTERRHSIPRELNYLLSTNSGRFVSYESFKEAIEKADERDRSKGIFPIGHDRALPWS